jgi:hypothetical protein
VHFAKITHLILFQRYESFSGVVEVDGASDEPISENAAEGKESDGIK